MTHAALKDRAEDVQTLREILLDYGDDENGPRYTMERRALNAAIAALSAMEGEAVAWEYVGQDGFRRLSFERNAFGSESRPLIYGDTAPPPQQAEDRSWLLELVPEAQTFNDGMEDREWCAGFNSCRRLILGNIERSALATHPTPSPGPQGGGEVDGNDPSPSDYRRCLKCGFVVDVLMGSCKPGTDAPISAAATPPAHQPGEVGEDVTKKYGELLYAVARKFPGESRHETALRYIRAAENQECGPAMVAALAPKEAGHG